MLGSASPKIFALLVDGLLLAFLAWMGADLYAWQAVTFLFAATLWKYLRTMIGTTDVGSPWLPLVTVSASAIALRGACMSWFIGPGNTHTMVAVFPALLIASLALLGLRYLLSREVNQTLWIFGCAGMVTFLRFCYLGRLELLPEEGYYWNYATHLAPGYIDHPPMVALIIRSGLALFGTNEFAIRIVAFAVSLCTAYLVTLLTEKIFPEATITTRYLAGALALLCPYLIGGGLFVSPDAMLALCWVAVLYCSYCALLEAKYSYWYLIGIFGGIGMLSKYSIVLLGIPMALFMLIDRDARSTWKRKEPYIALCIAALIFSPVIYWNLTNSMASFAFQSTRRAAAPSEFYLHRLVLDMMILVLPMTLFAGVRALWANPLSRIRLLTFLFLVCPVGVFAFYSVSHETKLNWTGPALMLLIPCAAHWFMQAQQDLQLQKILYRSFMPMVATLLVVLSIAFQYLAFGLPFVPYGASLHRMLGWESLTRSILEQAESYKVTSGTQPVIVAMDKHFIAANVSFYEAKVFSGQLPYQIGSRNIIGENALMWNFWSPAEAFQGADMLLVARNEGDLADARLSSFFASLEPIQSRQLTTRARATKGYFFRIAKQYKGLTQQPVEVAPQTKQEALPDVTPTAAPSVASHETSAAANEKGEELSPSPLPLESHQQDELQFQPAPSELNRS
jgi:dolichol-phosphate mannosyltransferase